MHVENHRLQGVDYWELPDHGAILPRFIVVHYTAGGRAQGSYDAMRAAGLSAHLLIERDGTVLQCVPFDRKAYHAGASRWRNYTGLNAHSVGIEVCNYGWTLRQDDGTYKRPDRFGATPTFQRDAVIVADHPNGWPRNAGWELYPAPQVAALKQVCTALLEAYPTILEIVGHDQIAPERKQDPGPAMPMDDLRSLVPSAQADAVGTPHRVLARSGLRVRGGPGTEFPIVTVLQFNDIVSIPETGGTWLPVDLEADGARDGFVHGGFVEPL